MKRQQYDDEVAEELRIDEMLLDEDSSSPSSNNNNNGTTQSSSSSSSSTGHGHGHSRGGNNIGHTIGTTNIDYNSVNACDGENMFSKALLNLNLNERNQIEEEIHGVSCMAITETPELIQESLKKFEFELKLIPIENKIAYQKAIEISNRPRGKSTRPTTTSSYILRNDYKLSFLRTELFNVPKSVLRYINYLNLLYQVYGDCALRRPIRLQDLNKEEFTFLKSGQYQLLPYRDRSGRRIFAVVPNNKDHVPGRILMKVFLYLWSVCVGSGDDTYHAETQRRGVIIVIFPSGQQVYDTVNDARQLENNNKKDDDDDNAIHNTTKYTKERLSVNHILAKLVPQRMTAIHICLPNSQIFGLVASFYGIALKSWNARTRIHLGNPTEIRYKLQQYGIPIELIPSTDTGNIKSVNLKQWIKLRMHLEREEQVAAQKMMIYNNNNNNNKKSISCLYSSDSSDNGSGSGGGSGGGDYFAKIPNTKNTIVECPLSNDVIFRRGKAMQNIHLGNLKFQNLIEAHMYEHTIDLDTSPLRRIEIEVELMNEVRKKIETTNGCDSGRFLTWDVEKSWWL
ncbi:hypothetical protein FRACYDRAFT_246827, partial [Fragilariopsis cylindrus CCMP1102]